MRRVVSDSESASAEGLCVEVDFDCFVTEGRSYLVAKFLKRNPSCWSLFSWIVVLKHIPVLGLRCKFMFWICKLDYRKGGDNEVAVIFRDQHGTEDYDADNPL